MPNLIEAFKRLSSMPDVMTRSLAPSTTCRERRKKFQHQKSVISYAGHRHPGISIQRSLGKLQAEATRALEEGEALTENENKVLVAALAECTLRSVLEAELALSSNIYWDVLFWQDQLKYPFQAWLEAGPYTWFQQVQEQEVLTPEDKIDWLQQLLNQLSTAAGIMQQHLTKKVVNTDANYLGAWSNEAFDLIDDVLNDALSLDRMFHISRMVMPTRSDPNLEECLTRAMRLKSMIEERRHRFQELTRPLRAPSFWRRRWLYLLIASPFVLYTVRWVWGRRSDIPKWAVQIIQSSRDFLSEHVYEPSRAIAKELIFNEHESITDVAALEDAKQSLRRMLEDFIKDTDPNIPDAERKAMAATMDMSVVSSRYEKSLVQAIKHVVTGDIVRMLLIQVQFIKKELLVAMSAIDELMDSNAINFRLMAIIPAIIAVYGVYRGCKSIAYTLTRRKGKKETVMLLRSFLLSMERMLNLRNVGASEDDIKYNKLARQQSHMTVQGLNSPHHHYNTASSSLLYTPPVKHQFSMDSTEGGLVMDDSLLMEEGAGQQQQQRHQMHSSTISNQSLDIGDEEEGGGGRGGTGRGAGGGRGGIGRAQSEEAGFLLSKSPSTAPSQMVFLKPHDLGILLLFIHQFSSIITRASKRFLTELELRNLQEDLSELAGDCGPVTVTQQLFIVQRMYRSYRFLQSQSSGLFSNL